LLQGYRLTTDHGDIAFCGVNLVEGRDETGAVARIVVDTGHAGRRRAVTEELAARGLTPSDIDVVVCTHAHWDHIENLNIFDRARIVLHRDERRYAKSPHRNDFGCPEWIDAVFELYKERIWEVEEGVAIIPGVEVIEAPGHSAGTIAVAASTAEGMAVITGDSIQNSTVAIERRNALVFWDEKLASRTIDKLVTIADVIYPGHDQAFRIRGDNTVEYVQELSLTLRHASPGQPGLRFDPSMELDPWVMPGIEEQRLPD
jgi:glyoxylase-like metal-dependent hydrolase (beta-lactamase superfamily II)